MEKILYRIEHGKGKMPDIDLLYSIAEKIDGNTICPLGDAAAWPVASAIRHFRKEFEFHIENPDIVKNINHGSLADYPVSSIQYR
jgi:NADH-quinone oxidoreductase subunit F